MDSETLLRTPLDPNTLSGADRCVFDWLADHFKAVPTSFYRQLRWRIGWEADFDLGGERKSVLVRGSRGEDYRGPLTMHEEARVHDVLERHGVLTPHVYGMIENPLAIVMEKIPGVINTGLIKDAVTQREVRRDFIRTLAKLHGIPVDEFGKIGLKVPKEARAIAFNLYGPCIDIVRKRLAGRPFGLVEFFARWLERNVPLTRTRSAFITADAGQFLYQGNAVTGLIDFEVAHVGDPAAEFAGMRVRDTTEQLGNIAELCDYYEALTGDRISKRVIEYHSAGFSSTNSMLMWPMIFEPEPEHDLIAYLQFTIVTSRWGLSAMAAADEVSLEEVPDPVRNPMAIDTPGPHLVRQLTGWETSDPATRHRIDGARALATYLQRCAEYGASVLQDDIADTEALTGQRPKTRLEADGLVDAFVRRADRDQDATLIRFFHRWLQRQNFLLKGCGSQAYLTESSLQPIPPRAADSDR